MPNDNLMPVYQELCQSYRAIDDFRAKLLGLLPLATGTGIFLLYSNSDKLPADMQGFLGPIGLFGFVITLGLFLYEIYGIRKCGALIGGGQQIEGWLRVDGQFMHRPHQVARVINEPFASGIIYPAVLAVWTFLGLRLAWPGYAWMIALFVFFVGWGSSLAYNRWLKSEGEVTPLTRLNQEILRAEEKGDRDALKKLLHPDFTFVPSIGEKQNLETFLDAVPIACLTAHLGRVGNPCLFLRSSPW